MEMTWPLQEHVRWHDGAAFTSADVCFTWKFVHQPRLLDLQPRAVPRHQGLPDAGRAHGRLHLGRGIRLLRGSLRGHPARAPARRHDDGSRSSATSPTTAAAPPSGTGPFKFAEWKSGEYIRVVRNPDYWRGPQYPRIDEIVWAFIPDSSTRLNALRAGALRLGPHRAHAGGAGPHAARLRRPPGRLELGAALRPERAHRARHGRCSTTCGCGGRCSTPSTGAPSPRS